MAKTKPTSVNQPPVLGELLAGLEALLVVAAPLFILMFCVVHTIQVQDAVRQIRLELPAGVELSLWSVITDFFLLLSSALFSVLGTGALVLVTVIGVVFWRLIAWAWDVLSTARSRNRYRGLSGEAVMETDAWDTPEQPAGDVAIDVEDGIDPAL